VSARSEAVVAEVFLPSFALSPGIFWDHNLNYAGYGRYLWHPSGSTFPVIPPECNYALLYFVIFVIFIEKNVCLDTKAVRVG
jgi:hypothetical protein